MSLLESFHGALEAKMGKGTFTTTKDYYEGKFGSVVLSVPLIDIDMAHDTRQIPRLVGWTLAKAGKK